MSIVSLKFDFVQCTVSYFWHGLHIFHFLTLGGDGVELNNNEEQEVRTNISVIYSTLHQGWW